ncbi:hypothetical protein [Serratia plymuthica]|uniref:hypothetical protein n=1 Tax=Serratia plymuthica TaxID=82996 RepID=UPI0014199C98|nr:hypothetical protein [Serratia plymuthica]NIC26384.1 hypothetical protein [Serratia plymuthica]
MGRGDFYFINSKKIYSESEKTWWVDLINTNCIWYDMIINPPDTLSTDKIIKNYLTSLERHLNEHCEKRFIYFLGTRKKVRFSTKKKVRYSPFTKNIVLTLLIGKEERKFKIKCSFFKTTPNGKLKVTPKIKVTDKYLYIEHEDGHVSLISIHDFLKEQYITLGINTEVHYVGYTRQPYKRPVDFIHRGLSKMFYNIPSEDNDFFVYFSIFNPRVISHNNDYNVSFNISNSQIDEVEVDKEGRIIENCFIRYFDAELQDDDKESKRPDLNNMFIDLVNHKKIKEIAVNLQYENNNEYFCFYSKSALQKNDHFFVIDFVDGKINLDRNKERTTHMEKILGNHSKKT